jgi:hypothetical protein
MRAQNIFDIGIFDSGLTTTISDILPQYTAIKKDLGTMKKFKSRFAFSPYPFLSGRRVKKAILLTT